jgi:hypothetical protein
MQTPNLLGQAHQTAHSAVALRLETGLLATESRAITARLESAKDAARRCRYEAERVIRSARYRLKQRTELEQQLGLVYNAAG